ncbi:MAG: hypothetical protein E7549_01130 [Ruminococcaceae bacterium]|nr:hypothetical protein [Oscillospiraceae bacterium]
MIRLFFGSPGSGKTTLACYVLHKYQRKKPKKQKYAFYYSNFTNSLSKKVDLKDLGQWTFPRASYLCVDEAGIEYNSRKYKSLPMETIGWFKLHRHYCVDVDFISQSWEDTDITIRRLADELWYIRRLGPFSLVRRVYRTVTVDDKTHQIIDAYRMGKLIRRILPPPFHEKTWFLIFRPRYYKYFDTLEAPTLPIRYKPKEEKKEEPKTKKRVRNIFKFKRKKETTPAE